jgi:hypothetical protein
MSIGTKLRSLRTTANPRTPQLKQLLLQDFQLRMQACR